MTRLLIYNIAYATGAPSGFCHNILSAHRYLRSTRKHLDRIRDYIMSTEADIVGLLEVDTGSMRSSFMNQAEVLAEGLDHSPHCSTKYGDCFTGRFLPILRKQGNAFLTSREQSKSVFHFFPGGFKRLIIELDLGSYSVYLVHLALSSRVRKMQLDHLSNLLSNRRRPVIVAGDFNAFGGVRELADFQSRAALINPNADHLPTYPSWGPKHQLDFILCSSEIAVRDFHVPSVRLSDHLPLVLDFKAPA